MISLYITTRNHAALLTLQSTKFIKGFIACLTEIPKFQHYKTNQSVIYRETIAVYWSQAHTKHVQTLRLGSTALVDHGLLIFEISRPHSDTPQSVGLLWTSDQPGAEMFTWQTPNIQNRYASGGIRTCNPSKQAGHRDRLVMTLSEERSLCWCRPVARPWTYWMQGLPVWVCAYIR